MQPKKTIRWAILLLIVCSACLLKTKVPPPPADDPFVPWKGSASVETPADDQWVLYSEDPAPPADVIVTVYPDGRVAWDGEESLSD